MPFHPWYPLSLIPILIPILEPTGIPVAGRVGGRIAPGGHIAPPLPDVG